MAPVPAFVSRSIEQILSVKESRKFPQLIKVSKELQSSIATSNTNPNAKSPTPNEIFEVIKQSCQTGNVQIVTGALDCLNKLMSFGVIRNAPELTEKESRLDRIQREVAGGDEFESDNEGEQKNQLMDTVIQTICNCYSGPDTHESIELHVVKLLVTSVTMCGVHDNSLLLSVRTCYQISLLSRSTGNQKAAKAGLTQMTNAIFARVEGVGGNLPSFEELAIPDGDKMSIKSFSLENTASSFLNSDSEGRLSRTVSLNETEAVSVDQSDMNPLERKPSLRDMPTPRQPENAENQMKYHIPDQALAKDAYVVFRAFCKISIKTLPENSEPKSYAFRSKVLSLELIYYILQNSGQTFRTGDIFVNAIKKYLVLSICGNAVYKDKTILDYVLKIFSFLLDNFNQYLKYELEVCFKEIFFNILEARVTTTDHKIAILSTLQKICSDSQKLVDIFINYDCDPDSLNSNIYEKIVQDIAKIAQSKVEYDPEHPSTEEYILKMKALECIITILQSLVGWIRDKEEVNEDDSNQNLPTVNTQKSLTETSSDTKQDQFAQIKHQKQTLQYGIEQFNWDMKKGMKILIDSGCIKSKDPKDIAYFLLHTPGLNKKMIGEYLGKGDEHHINTLHAFVDYMDFTNMDFLSALRTFLQAFLLPGEAQQIDRFMLKFAERFVDCNQNIFANADTAYVLSYSIIMLNVDQHNSKIKKRMTVEEFIRNNRGINDGKDVPEEILRAIFDNISKNELKMKDEDQHLLVGDIGKSSKNKNAQQLDSKEILKRTQVLFSDTKRKKASAFYNATRLEHVKPMFEVSWMAILASISGSLQVSDDKIFNMCLQGFFMSIHISCVFYLDLARETFFSTLLKFTNLFNDDRTPVIKKKNMSAIRVLVEIALSDGNYLKNSWFSVLRCISQLEKFQLLNDQDMTGKDSDSKLHETFKSLKRTKSISIESPTYNMVVAVDRVFSFSEKLNGDAIVDFVKALCQVSLEEINTNASGQRARMYSLQKIVEISYYNMSRIRLEWSKIWLYLGEHFNQVGCHKSSNIATFAIDSLRQLSMKFLEKGELAHFQFQKDFLSPFPFIFGNSQSLPIKDMVMSCISQMIAARATNIKSGWKPIMSVFKSASLEKNEEIFKIAFESCKTILDNHFESICTHGALADLIQVLVHFARNPNFPSYSLKSVENLRRSIRMMTDMSSTQKDLVISLNEQVVSQKDSDRDYKFWLPILSGLLEIVMTCELEVRTRALNYLMNTLKTYGESYSIKFWETVFNDVLLPVFDLLKPGSKIKFDSKVDSSEWLNTTFVYALRAVVELFSFYYTKLSFLLNQMLNLLKTCINQENQTVSKIGASCLQSLIIDCSKHFDDSMWDTLCKFIDELLVESTPVLLMDEELVKFKTTNSNQKQTSSDQEPQSISLETLETEEIEEKQLSKNSKTHGIVIKCVIHLLLVQTVNDILNGEHDIYDHISAKNILRILGSIEKSYEFSKTFNSRTEHRKNLAASGLFPQVPQLLKQEISSYTCILTSLFRMYSDITNDRVEVKPVVEKKLLDFSGQLLSSFERLNSSKSRDVGLWAKLVAYTISSISEMTEDCFKRHISFYYPLLVSLLGYGLTPEIRATLKEIFNRVGHSFSITKTLT